MLKTAKRDSHIDPPTSSYAIMRRVHPYRGENPEPGKDVHGELDPTPGIRERPRPEAAILTAEVAYCDSVLAGPLAQLGLQRRWRPDHDARLQSASHCRRESAVWRHCRHGVFIAWLGVAVLSANDMVVVPIRSGMRLRLGRLRPRCYSQTGPHEPIAAELSCDDTTVS